LGCIWPFFSLHLRHPAFKEYDGVGMTEGTLLVRHSRRINELRVDGLDRDREEILFKPLSGITKFWLLPVVTLRPSPWSLSMGKQIIIDDAF